MILKLIDWYLARKGFARVLSGPALEWVPPSVREMTDAAIPLALEEDPKPHDGEWKRHQVYARMLKRFPQMRKQDVSWAVERAVRMLPPREKNG